MDQLKIIANETVDIKGIGYYSLGATRKILSDTQMSNLGLTATKDETPAN